MAGPKIIMHNSISLDGSFKDIEVDMGIHYGTSASFGEDVHLVGANTAKTGIEMFGGVPPEEDTDFRKPERESTVPLWALVDSKGILKGSLHVFRRFELCRDVVMLVSGSTPEDYLEYLKERDYDFIVAGEEHVDLKEALEVLNKKYKAGTVLVDSGSSLNGALLEEDLVDEISLIMMPLLTGKGTDTLFANIGKNEPIELELLKCEKLERDHVWLVYKVKRS
ncbi:2,5-diamino-6-(ribosylamino)-4(3H)-pyrimidinone 5'-phosphate reductase [Methanococcoides vulcani]|uniref:2,5-diamino-6-(Ribosylamino)-4(3H)-pyrimidinone 5'-phosphate reductase n=1 Tax=Methanococcoides vulcani TaxID=1353158 RepID=A0A1H9ZZD4_9EURY|nr:RibD family protein [Methanococcoides vulcani]SES87149.1 2,5-diamino-6-(ribosylamino)-4(3H)-pyrimidinone 5'-phosphate reductase [Methanococcoides vulcani]